MRCRACDREMPDDQALWFVPQGESVQVMETLCPKCLAIVRKEVYGMGGADADLDYLELDIPGAKWHGFTAE